MLVKMFFKTLTQYERAALFARNANHGRNPPSDPGVASISAQQIYHSGVYRTIYAIAAGGALILAFWEPPVPNIDKDALTAVRVADFAFLAVVAWDLLLQCAYYGTRKAVGRGWFRMKLLTWMLLLANLIASIALPDAPYIARLLRPLLLIERLRNVRKIAGRVAATAPKIINVGLLLALHLLLSAVLAFVLFAGIDDKTGVCEPFHARSVPTCSTFDPTGCHNYFSDVGESMLHLVELTTGANFPAIMMPVYKCNPWNALFFVVYILISVYLLLNLTLAVTYSTFKDEMKDEVIVKYKRMFKGYDMAFYEISSPGQFQSGTETLKRDAFIKFFGCLRPDAEIDAAGRLFDVFDGDGRGEIDSREFRRLLLNFSRLRIVPQLRVSGAGGGRVSLRVNANTLRLIQADIAKIQASSPPRSGDAASTAGDSTAVVAIRGPEAVAASAVGGAGPDGQAAGVRSSGMWAAVVHRASVVGGFNTAATNLENDDDYDEDVEVLDTNVPGSASAEIELGTLPTASPAGSTGGESSMVPQGTARVVVNPLSGGGAIAAGSVASPASADRALRVDSMRGPVALGDAASDASAAAAAMVDAAAPSWGAPRYKPKPTMSTADLRAGSRRRCDCSSFCSSTCQKVSSALSIGLSEDTSPDGQGRAADAVGGRKARMPRGVDPYSLRGKIVALLRSFIVTALFDLAVLINSVAGLAQLILETDEPTSTEVDSVTQLQYVQYVTLAIFVAEVLFKLLVWGPRNYWRESALHKIDVVLVAASVVAASLEAADLASKSESSAVMILRFVRLVRVFRILPGFGLTVSAFGDILPVLARYVIIVVAVFYTYAIIGMTAFAGKLSYTNPAVAATSYGQANYFSINFDTFPGALLSLFYMLVLNDWPMLMDAAVAGTGTKAARGYFLSFWILCVVLCMNVVVAFVIEAFSTESEKRAIIQRMEDTLALRAATASAAATSSGALAKRSANAHLEHAVPVTSGVEDWRRLILESGVDFSGYHLSKTRHHLDIYDALYKDDIRAAHSATFAALRTRRTP